MWEELAVPTGQSGPERGDRGGCEEPGRVDPDVSGQQGGPGLYRHCLHLERQTQQEHPGYRDLQNVLWVYDQGVSYYPHAHWP